MGSRIASLIFPKLERPCFRGDLTAGIGGLPRTESYGAGQQKAADDEEFHSASFSVARLNGSPVLLRKVRGSGRGC
jgi:hypothetical protein